MDKNFLKFIDRFLAPAFHLGEPSDLYRARSFLLLATFLTALYSLRLLYWPDPANAMATLFAWALALVIGLILRKGGLGYRPFACFYMLSLLAIEVKLELIKETVYSPFYLWVPFMTIAVSFMAGIVYGALAGVIGCAAIFYLLLTNAAYGPHLREGQTFPEFLGILGLHFFFVQLMVAAIGLLVNFLRERDEAELNRRRVLRSQITRRTALAEVVGKLAHEINNPLAIIDGCFLRFKKNLSRGHHVETDDDYLQRNIAGAMDRIQTVISGLKAFSEGDRQEPLQETKSYDLIEQSKRHSQEYAHSRGIALQASMLGPNVSVVCRPRQIAFVLSSLLENAIDASLRATAPGEVTVGAQLQKSLVRFEVIDNGPGIGTAVAERIFQPFVTTKPLGDSMGLSLSVCLGIVNEHGGDIGFLRRDEKTVFWLELPRFQIGL